MEFNVYLKDAIKLTNANFLQLKSLSEALSINGFVEKNKNIYLTARYFDKQKEYDDSPITKKNAIKIFEEIILEYFKTYLNKDVLFYNYDYATIIAEVLLDIKDYFVESYKCFMLSFEESDQDIVSKLSDILKIVLSDKAPENYFHTLKNKLIINTIVMNNSKYLKSKITKLSNLQDAEQEILSTGLDIVKQFNIIYKSFIEVSNIAPSNFETLFFEEYSSLLKTLDPNKYLERQHLADLTKELDDELVSIADDLLKVANAKKENEAFDLDKISFLCSHSNTILNKFIMSRKSDIRAIAFLNTKAEVMHKMAIISAYIGNSINNYYSQSRPDNLKRSNFNSFNFITGYLNSETTNIIAKINKEFNTPHLIRMFKLIVKDKNKENRDIYLDIILGIKQAFTTSTYVKCAYYYDIRAAFDRLLFADVEGRYVGYQRSGYEKVKSKDATNLGFLFDIFYTVYDLIGTNELIDLMLSDRTIGTAALLIPTLKSEDLMMMLGNPAVNKKEAIKLALSTRANNLSS